ncbi:FAD-dependent monooxygenase [Pseudonocardia ailaonensis]|uniref:FAD-dependent monooxygenase n=1 Tax=Pseudonocardia ailaonensis TaxID=367279 RepID=A0ABN2NIX0_9PSEU
MTRTILISGAGIAGPALAASLARAGNRVTVVERAPALRTGGSAVDFRGEVHLEVLRRTGLLEPLRAQQTGGSPWSFVDDAGHELATLPASYAGGAIEVRRGDLSRTLAAAADGVEYLFGDSITALRDGPHGVEVGLASGVERVVDLVIGADGLHSAVRRLAFGPEERFVRHFGYRVAGWDLPNTLGADRTTVLHSVPGRTAALTADPHDPGTARALFVHAATGDLPRDRPARLDELREAYAGVGWWVPELLATLDAATDVYVDAIARVRLPRWSQGRIVLLGDAGYGATLGGMGAGTAVVGAYVLAAELAATPDHAVAFARYEDRLRRYVTRCQRGAAGAGKFLAPRTAAGIALRTRIFRSSPGRKLLLGQADSQAAAVELPEVARDTSGIGESSGPPAR